MGSKTFTEFEKKKNVTETIGDQAASLLRPLKYDFIVPFYYLEVSPKYSYIVWHPAP